MAPIIPLIGAAAAAAGGAASAAGVTGTILGVSASTISTVATAVGLVASVAGTAIQAQQSANQQEDQARAIEEQARQQAITTNIEAENVRRQNRIRASMSRASLAEGGSLSGTAFGVLDQNSVSGELDALTVEYQGRNASRRSMQEGASLRRAARDTRVGGMISAGAQLAGGIGRQVAAFDGLNVEPSYPTSFGNANLNGLTY